MFRHRRGFAFAVAYFPFYLLLEWLCYARPVLVPAITPWHPQAALTLAFLILAGWEWFPVAVLTVFISASQIRHVQASSYLLLATSAWLALCYAGLALLARRRIPVRVMESTVAAARFACAAGVATLLAAAGSVGVFVLAAVMSPADALRGIARSWLADLNGILMLTPLLLTGDFRSIPRALRGHGFELFAQFALVLAVLWLIFALPDNEQLRVFYLLFVPVIWIALRHAWIGALLAVLVIQAGLVFAAESDIHTPRFIDTQFLMLTLSLTALVLGSVVVDRRRSEAQLRERDAVLSRAMRFAVAGEFASATAHELNQPITALVSYLNAAEILAGTAAEHDERLRSTVRKATQEALRAADVLHRLRNFYTGGRSRRERVRLRELSEAVAADFAEALRRSGVRLEVQADATLPEIEADATQLQIVLHNLIANAIDAVSVSGGAERRIEVGLGTAAGGVSITVEDSGAGIPAQVAGRLFEPFVTSKPDGMGLGLAISRTLVRASGGELELAGGGRLGGARLRVTLPTRPPDETERA